jgi:branched-subunit amino acid ABC-type transport system permease component
MDLTQLIQILIFGLVDGSVIAVGAVGLTLSYGITRFINFAYGEFLSYGAFLTLFVSGFGIGLPAAGAIAIAGIGVLGVGVARTFYDPLSDRGPIALLITSIGVSFMLRHLLRAGIGTEARQFDVPLVRPWTVWELHVSPISIGVFIVAVLTMIGIHLLLQRTMLGKKMRATSSNQQLAVVSGINTDSVVARSWFISAAIGALCGILLGLRFPPFRPTMGWDFLIVVFAATILGGIGRPYGAVAGSLIVGVAMSAGSFYVSSEYTFAYAFAILVIALLVRPEGLVRGEF